MSNVTTLIFVESRYQVNRKRIKAVVKRTLDSNNIQLNVEVSVAIVGDRKMKALNEKYRGKTGTTNVLSFPLAEGEQMKSGTVRGSTSRYSPVPNRMVLGRHLAMLPKSDTTYLGDIVISYPVVIKEAARDETMVDEKIEELVEHGLHHLLGIHHD
ncbi:MAG: rRNA maturation RNase YbeY [bacterium]|nr:rRNA maturation RNase YbeY [bacterium]